MTGIITASMDGKLSWSEWILMKTHLIACDPCVNFLKQISFIRSVLSHGDSKLGQQDTSPKLSEDARTRIKQALEISGSAI